MNPREQALGFQVDSRRTFETMRSFAQTNHPEISSLGGKDICFFQELGYFYLDHPLILHRMHLKRLGNEFCGYFNEELPHQSFQQCIPNRPDGHPINRSERFDPLHFLEDSTIAIPEVPFPYRLI